MNRLEIETSTVIDPRYESMLKQIAAMLNNTKNASSIKTISFFLLFFCIAIFYIKFIIN